MPIFALSSIAVVTLVISGVTGLIFIKCAQDVGKISPLNSFESELSYFNPFSNVSLPNEAHFANFAQNWLPWQSSLEESVKEVRINYGIYYEIPTIW